MVAETTAGSPDRVPSKRKRSPSIAEVNGATPTLLSTLDDLLLTVSTVTNAQSLLNFTDTSHDKSILERLTTKDYANLDELTKHLTHACHGLVPSIKSSETREHVLEAYRNISTLLRLADKENLGKPKSPVTENAEVPQGFPDRPPEKKALFASTVTGPLFTSVTNLRAEDQDLELPSHLQIIDVLPTPSNGPRALEDLHQDAVLGSSPSYLNAGRQPINTTRPVRRSQFESFGPDVDSSGAILSRRTTNTLLTHRSRLKTAAATHENGSVPASQAATTDQTQHEDFSFDEDLLNTFDSQEERQENITAMLMELADFQTRRLAQSAFSSPSEEEQALAQTISKKMQDTITRQEIKPAQLVPNGVRGDFSLMRYTPSCTGTLPPTIAQAVRATYSQVVPLRPRPLQTTRIQHYAKETRTNQSNRASSQSTPHTQHNQLT